MANHQIIREVLAQVWPAVRDSIAEQVDRAHSNGKSPGGIRRRVVEQTLWELERCGRLMTAEQAEVIEKARAWHAGWGADPITADDVDTEDVTEEDVLLYHAIGQLPSAK